MNESRKINFVQFVLHEKLRGGDGLLEGLCFAFSRPVITVRVGSLELAEFYEHTVISLGHEALKYNDKRIICEDRGWLHFLTIRVGKNRGHHTVYTEVFPCSNHVEVRLLCLSVSNAYYRCVFNLCFFFIEVSFFIMSSYNHCL